MKTNRFFLFLSVIIAITVMLSVSCKKAAIGDVTTPTGHLFFHLTTNIGTIKADSGKTEPDANGRRFQLTYAEFYVSGVTLYNYTTATPYVIPGNAIVFKYIDNEDYYVADVPAGNYGSVSFNIGLNPLTNLISPYSPGYPTPNPLSPRNPSMYFGQGQGYIFLNVQGLADTTASHNGPVNFPFRYQLGTNSMFENIHITVQQFSIGVGQITLESIRMPVQQFSIVAGQITYVHMVCDYGSLLQGIPFVHSATPFNADSSVARQIANRISNNFIRYELQTIQP